MSASKSTKLPQPESLITDNITRRSFVKGSLAGLSGVALKTTGIGVATNFLMNGKAQAATRLNLIDYYRSRADKIPPGAKPKLCQDQILCEALLYILEDGPNIQSLRTILAGENESSRTFTINYSSWYCEPLTYVAINSFNWKTRPQMKLDLARGPINHLNEYFYHNFALKEGIEDFYFQHVRKPYSSYIPKTEKWLVHNIFACAEEYPKHGVKKAQEYLSGNYETRVQLISDLRKKFESMNWSESDKLDRDISGKSGKGPLNNWYRLLSAQWGAFFLTVHYDSLEGKNGFGNFIYQNIELPLQKIGKLRGPPYYLNGSRIRGV